MSNVDYNVTINNVFTYKRAREHYDAIGGILGDKRMVIVKNCPPGAVCNIEPVHYGKSYIITKLKELNNQVYVDEKRLCVISLDDMLLDGYQHPIIENVEIKHNMFIKGHTYGTSTLKDAHSDKKFQLRVSNYSGSGIWDIILSKFHKSEHLVYGTVLRNFNKADSRWQGKLKEYKL
jgi:hypothetical protein